MKALVYQKFGSTDELKLTEVQKPSPNENEVLIKIEAISINSWDYDLIKGKPYAYRPLFGFSKPRYQIIGIDVAGRVETVGNKVKLFKAGDEVFGDLSPSGFGSYAEYVCTTENLLAHKSPKMSFEEAASIPHAGVMAFQGLKQYGEIKPGQKVLLNGAGGGVGTFCLQLAKQKGAEVTCVDKGSKLETLKSLGADHVIDYQQEDFTKTGKQYDLIIDPVANRSISDYSRALSPKGAFVMIGGTISTILQVFTLGALKSKKNGKRIGFLPHKPNSTDLNKLTQLYESGIIKPVIDKIYAFDKLPEAVQYLGDGKVMGKLVVKV